MKNREFIKYTSIFTVLIIFFYIITSFLPVSIVNKVEAASIEKDELLKGLGIALGLILLARIGKSINSPETESNQPSTYNLSQNELDILARVIHAEARGEPYQGQVAVGAVVLNRLKNPDFPDTIKEIVYQDRQFSSVDDGQINLIPNSSAYRAANDASNGIDPSNGALYFYNPDKAKTLWWLSTRTKTLKIANHVFAK